MRRPQPTQLFSSMLSRLVCVPAPCGVQAPVQAGAFDMAKLRQLPGVQVPVGERHAALTVRPLLARLGARRPG